jgi:hypothetical protein
MATDAEVMAWIQRNSPVRSRYSDDASYEAACAAYRRGLEQIASLPEMQVALQRLGTTNFRAAVSEDGVSSFERINSWTIHDNKTGGN